MMQAFSGQKRDISFSYFMAHGGRHIPFFSKGSKCGIALRFERRFSIRRAILAMLFSAAPFQSRPRRSVQSRFFRIHGLCQPFRAYSRKASRALRRCRSLSRISSRRSINIPPRERLRQETKNYARCVRSFYPSIYHWQTGDKRRKSEWRFHSCRKPTRPSTPDAAHSLPAQPSQGAPR